MHLLICFGAYKYSCSEREQQQQKQQDMLHQITKKRKDIVRSTCWRQKKIICFTKNVVGVLFMTGHKIKILELSSFFPIHFFSAILKRKRNRIYISYNRKKGIETSKPHKENTFVNKKSATVHLPSDPYR